MSFRHFQPPHPDTFLAEHLTLKLKVYAYLANVPLYATVRIIGRAIPERKSRSFWLGWLIEEGRWARTGTVRDLPREVLDWAALHVAEAYPDLETATGMTAEELAEVKAEQAEKRARHKK